LAGGSSSASTPKDLTRNLAFLQNCETKETAGAPGPCVNNQQATVYTLSIIKEGLFGGAACPTLTTRTVYSSCVSPVTPPATNLNESCAGRCNAIADGVTTSCSCDAFCIFSDDCCADLATTCPNQMPVCGAPNSLECGTTAYSPAGALCSCDGGCGSAGKPACCSGYRENCSDRLCATKFERGTGAKPDWCTRAYNPATDEGKPCSCDAECNLNGDCCADYAHTCMQKTICAKSFNCGFAFLTTSFEEYGCACDHSCIANGDCCSDYMAVCEVFATCRGSCGSMPWDSRVCLQDVQYQETDPDCRNAESPGTPLPWDRANTLDRWCGCDSLCEASGDCCPDKGEYCSSGSRERG
jgi:hypothetical protein